METLKQTAEQFQTLYKGMTPSQRGTLLIVPLLVFGALGLLMYTSGIGSSDEYILGGKVFSSQELSRAQSALGQSGLSDYRIDGNRIAVSRSNVDRYTATLVANTMRRALLVLKTRSCSGADKRAKSGSISTCGG